MINVVKNERNKIVNTTHVHVSIASFSHQKDYEYSMLSLSLD
jgi:hypothetical protein